MITDLRIGFDGMKQSDSGPFSVSNRKSTLLFESLLVYRNELLSKHDFSGSLQSKPVGVVVVVVVVVVVDTSSCDPFGSVRNSFVR